MSFLFDNLIAILVGTVLLGALLILQQRGQQTSIDAVQRHQAQAMAAELVSTLEREIENARGRDETERVFAVAAGGGALSASGYRFRMLQGTGSDGNTFTRQLSFPTLLDPDRLGGSPLGVVTYTVEETGETLFIDGRDRPLLRARRFVFPRGGPLAEAGVFERLVDFDVTAFEPDGTAVLSRMEIADTPVRIHLELRYAPVLNDLAAGDQMNGLRVSTRYARTVRIPASTAYEDAGTDITGTPGGIPPLPGDDDYDGDDYDGDDSDGDSGAGTPPRDPDPDPDPEPTVVMCHNPGPDQSTMTVPASTASTHAGHGDTRGPCADPEPAPEPEPEPEPPSDPDADRDDDDKVAVCHEPGDKDETKVIKWKDIDKHLDHGDYRGECRISGTPSDDDKIVVCHEPGDKDETKVIKRKDLDDHLDHGDYRGECR